MAPLRIRYSQGVATIDVDLENATVQELQQEIRKATNILPSQQEVKTGYPPRAITLISELPVSSLGLKRGDQLIINELKGVSAPPVPIPNPIPPVTRTPTRATEPSAPLKNPIQPSSSLPSVPETVQTPSGILVHRVVPDDNSCLFASVGILFEQDTKAAPKLRELVADVIRKDPITYDDAVLGRPREDYIKTILKPATWGGAIELAIFSEHYGTEISSFDVETGRCDRFGEGKFSTRAILLYSGIHYDAVSLSPIEDAPLDFHTTIFPASDQSIMDGASQLAAKLRAKGAFTNTATFDLRCEVCRIGLKGEKEATAHAKETGHTAFGEY